MWKKRIRLMLNRMPKKPRVDISSSIYVAPDGYITALEHAHLLGGADGDRVELPTCYLTATGEFNRALPDRINLRETARASGFDAAILNPC
jgi:hypothetical protein